MLEIRLAAGSVPTEALTQHLLCLFLTSGRCQPPSLFRVPCSVACLHVPPVLASVTTWPSSLCVCLCVHPS